MATTFEIDFGYARFSVQSEERLIQNAKERAREKGKKGKEKKRRKNGGENEISDSFEINLSALPDRKRLL